MWVDLASSGASGSRESGAHGGGECLRNEQLRRLACLLAPTVWPPARQLALAATAAASCRSAYYQDLLGDTGFLRLSVEALLVGSGTSEGGWLVSSSWTELPRGSMGTESNGSASWSTGSASWPVTAPFSLGRSSHLEGMDVSGGFGRSLAGPASVAAAPAVCHRVCGGCLPTSVGVGVRHSTTSDINALNGTDSPTVPSTLSQDKSQESGHAEGVREQALCALWNLCQGHIKNQRRMLDCGGYAVVIQALARGGSERLVEYAAAVIRHTASSSIKLLREQQTEYRNGIRPLCRLIRLGSNATKIEAAGALWACCSLGHPTNQEEVRRAGGISALLELAHLGVPAVQEIAVGTLGCVVAHQPASWEAVVGDGGVPMLLRLLYTGTVGVQAASLKVIVQAQRESLSARDALSLCAGTSDAAIPRPSQLEDLHPPLTSATRYVSSQPPRRHLANRLVVANCTVPPFPSLAEAPNSHCGGDSCGDGLTEDEHTELV